MARSASILEASGDGIDMATHLEQSNRTCSKAKLDTNIIPKYNIADTSSGNDRKEAPANGTQMNTPREVGLILSASSARHRHHPPHVLNKVSDAAVRPAGTSANQKEISSARGPPAEMALKRKGENISDTPAMVSGRHSKGNIVDFSALVNDMTAEVSKHLCSLRKEMQGEVTNKEALQNARSIFSMEEAKKLQQRRIKTCVMADIGENTANA